METEYKVRLEIFEGPLDLLLYLIKRDELDIYDISLERITQQYLEYLQAFKELNIDVAGEFVVMAANLIYLKSRSLLPADQQPPEEDVDEDDPRWDLIRQLIEYKKFKEAASHLQARELEQERIFARIGDGIVPEMMPLHLGEVGIFQLINAFQNVINGWKRRTICARFSAKILPCRTRSRGFCKRSPEVGRCGFRSCSPGWLLGLKSSSRFSPCSS